MSAQDIEVVTVIVPNPLFDSSNNAEVVSSDLGYSVRIRNNFRTLSSNNPHSSPSIEGLFYVPTLNSSHNATCEDALSIIPDDVTTMADFPHKDYPMIAIFPWTESEECTSAYLAQTRVDAVMGVITFQPGSGGQPADSNDPSWNLSNDPNWKTDNQYPIYAISASAGSNFLEQLSLYSGDMASAPNGQNLIEQYDSKDFPRLFTQVELQGSNVPSIWIFLIIVLAVLLGIVILASVVMHLLQRHQRKDLQRRLERGEVDLETLGIKKMNVPQEKIDEMPKYVYTHAPETVTSTVVPISPSKSPKGTSIQPQTSFSQTVCPICLDDFVVGETEVRELPCKHIFHPECIDLFLRDNSSLCPMCKKSALPAGYFPIKVTNLMVRRERLVRRMRERRRAAMVAAMNRSEGDPPAPTTAGEQISQWVRRMRAGNRPVAPPASSGGELESVGPRLSTNPPSAPGTGDIEMTQHTVSPRHPSMSQPLNARRQTIAIPAEIAAQGAGARRAWRRERLAQQQDRAYDQQAEVARQVDEGRSRWRRVLGRIMPGVD